MRTDGAFAQNTAEKNIVWTSAAITDAIDLNICSLQMKKLPISQAVV